MNTKFISFIAIIFSLSSLAGHHEGGHMHSDSPKWQIKAYTGAAPSFIGDFASVIGADGTVLKEDIKEFYLGQKDEGVRGERRWKKKKEMG